MEMKENEYGSWCVDEGEHPWACSVSLKDSRDRKTVECWHVQTSISLDFSGTYNFDMRAGAHTDLSFEKGCRQHTDLYWVLVPVDRQAGCAWAAGEVVLTRVGLEKRD